MPTPKTEADRTLAEFWRSYVGSGGGGFRYVLGHPLEALRAFWAIQKLPFVYPASQSDTPGGREVREVLCQSGPLGLPARWWGFAAVPVVENPEDALKNPEAKRLRYNLRLAEAEDITVRIADPSERITLREKADLRERTHPDPMYRVTTPRNDDLLDHELWIVAEDSAGDPLLLAVVAVDGEFAVLRYFRALGDSEKHSLSRYSAHQWIVESMAEQGVRWLIDTNPPAAQTNGVRLFQRIVGFRHVRIRRPREQK